MKTGDTDMKLLKIENDQGQFLDKAGNFQPIDRITKDDLLLLADLTIKKEAEFDEYDEEKIKNQVHQIVYKSIYGKLQELSDRKQAFIDESERLYLADYQKYKEEPSQDLA